MIRGKFIAELYYQIRTFYNLIVSNSNNSETRGRHEEDYAVSPETSQPKTEEAVIFLMDSPSSLNFNYFPLCPFFFF